ncbi:phospholipase D-like domain-containing protein [Halanaerobacter jeridensis]|uniref:Cardiolipin synthase n=1 Tax=Halanaerobacter jeridensis TaxID=706427 RepID=A0A939BR81_9FIRM|nr:phosphatidylserine/phosphatidylglycerophosphate/cardiolipin synthase family protein [Halanaerobacter jeridensis]MBM7555726.1 cardiolipin synthase [Halanaerobacter jeridensis]
MEQELLINADEAYSEILTQIRLAQESIHICMYIWRDDKIGNLIAQELLEAANRGVNIKIIKDKAGSVFERVELEKQSFFHKQKNLSSLIKEGILSLLYYRENDVSNDQLTNRKLNQLLEHPNIKIDFEEERHDHSKYFIFDNRTLILGGMNIGDKKSTPQEQKYRDYMIKLTGKEVVAYFFSRLQGKKSCVGQELEFYFNHRESNLYEIKPQVIDLLEQAQERVDIEMAYFGDCDITDKIIEICQRGIEVTIITSRNSNVQRDLNKCVLRKLIKKTGSELTIYLSEQLIHSKFMCIDQQAFFLGSANFNKLGMEQLSELNVLVKNSSQIYQQWKEWRKRHLNECVLISQEEDLDYNKLVALTERVLC